MGFFSKKKSRHIVEESFPVWNDTLWRSHLRACAVGTEHHLSVYGEQIQKDRKECARLYRNGNNLSCRKAAASALANKRVITVLNALSPICNALHRRTESLAGYTSLAQVQEPARAGMVTIIFAAAHLNVSYLTDTVDFLREQFSTAHIDEVQEGEGQLAPLINPTVRDSIDSKFPTRSDVDGEIASAVLEYLGIDINDPDAGQVSENVLDSNTKEQTSTPYPPSPPDADETSMLTDPVGVPSNVVMTNATAQEVMPLSQTTPLSGHSSELGTAMSPELSQISRQTGGGMGTNINIPPMTDMGDAYNANRLFATHSTQEGHSGTISTATALAEARKARDSLAASLESGSVKRGRGSMDELHTSMAVGIHDGNGLRSADGHDVKVLEVGPKRERDISNLPQHIKEFEDSDGMLLQRYQHLTMVMAM